MTPGSFTLFVALGAALALAGCRMPQVTARCGGKNARKFKEVFDEHFLDDLGFDGGPVRPSPSTIWPNLFAGPMRYEMPFDWGHRVLLPMMAPRPLFRMDGLPEFDAENSLTDSSTVKVEGFKELP